MIILAFRVDASRFLDMVAAYMEPRLRPSTSDVGGRVRTIYSHPRSPPFDAYIPPFERVDGDFGQVTSVKPGMKYERVYKSVRN